MQTILTSLSLYVCVCVCVPSYILLSLSCCCALHKLINLMEQPKLNANKNQAWQQNGHSREEKRKRGEAT